VIDHDHPTIIFPDDNAMTVRQTDVPTVRLNTTRRWALYFSPDTELGHLGRQWLSHEFEPAAAWTSAPRRYGFHATLKAPFRLAPGFDLKTLIAAVSEWAAEQRPFEVPLCVQWLGDFLVLRPSPGVSVDALNRLAASAVERFDGFRAELSAAEMERRLAAPKSPLTAREVAFLDRWGYPYVFEAFRFHCTLTEALPSDRRLELFALAEKTFNRVLSKPVPIDQVALVEEPAPGAEFVRVRSFPLGMSVPGAVDSDCSLEPVA
jgi:hypothetical protein